MLASARARETVPHQTPEADRGSRPWAILTEFYVVIAIWR